MDGWMDEPLSQSCPKDTYINVTLTTNTKHAYLLSCKRCSHTKASWSLRVLHNDISFLSQRCERVLGLDYFQFKFCLLEAVLMDSFIHSFIFLPQGFLYRNMMVSCHRDNSFTISYLQFVKLSSWKHSCAN